MLELYIYLLKSYIYNYIDLSIYLSIYIYIYIYIYGGTWGVLLIVIENVYGVFCSNP